LEKNWKYSVTLPVYLKAASIRQTDSSRTLRFVGEKLISVLMSFRLLLDEEVITEDFEVIFYFILFPSQFLTFPGSMRKE
jgi:hypothetical protein